MAVACAGGCDLSWEEDAQDYFVKALKCEETSDFEGARSFYEKALWRNPYHLEANRNLGELLEKRFFEESLAIAYYQRYLDLKPKDNLRKHQIQSSVVALQQILAGEIEDPADAAEDLLWAIQARRPEMATRRLSGKLIQTLLRRGKPPTEYVEEWVEAVGDKSTRLIYREVSLRGEDASAVVEAEFLDGSVVAERWALLFRPEQDGLWRLDGYRRTKGSAR